MLRVHAPRHYREGDRADTREIVRRRPRRRASALLKVDASLNTPLPPLEPYKRCACGVCRSCRENAKWDRIFAKFEIKEDHAIRGFCRSPISDL